MVSWLQVALALILAAGLPSGAQAQAASTAPAKRPQKPPAATRAASAPAPSAATTVVKPGYAVTIGPVPAWVMPTPLPAGGTTEQAPMHYRIIDQQIRVADAGTAEYLQVVRVVNQPSGLGPAAQFEFEYDPAFESLVLHGLEVVREGRRLERLDRNRIELLQREKQLEQRIYDGRITVSIVVEDVRVGDEIDLRYTRIGQNPVFGGKFVRNDWLSSPRGPVRMNRTRLLAPQARQIRQSVGPADVAITSTVHDGWRDTTFVREQVPQVRIEPSTPFNALRGELLQLSEFADWAEVAAWGGRLFGEQAADAKTAERAAAIRATQPTAAGQVLEALRFVQQEVRYFGVEIGPGSHKPNPPDQVLQQRFGDCKDKVTLLTALLRALQIPARPVLVNSQLRDRVEGWLPSPLAFDHVIARVDVDGSTLYLDPTRSHQSGPLAARQVFSFGKGLELGADASALAALPTTRETERLRVEDRFTVRQFAEPIVLESRIVYRGDLAEFLREAIATQGIASVGDTVSAPYLKAYPQLKRLAPAVAAPVEGDDAVAILQRFELPAFWRFPEQRALVGEVLLWAPVEALVPPKMEARRQPLGLALRGVIRHVATVQFPEDVFRQGESRSSEEGDAHFQLLLRQASTPSTLEFSVEARVTADQVEPAQWQSYTSALTKSLPRLGNVAAVSAVPLARVPPLTERLRAIDDDLRRGRLKVVTSTQAQAQAKTILLTAQIDGGRLAGPLKAQALVARGIELDHSGRSDEARADFDAALALEPESLDALNAAATNAQGRGDSERAVELAGRVLAKSPRDAQALGTRALARYLSGQWDSARGDWTTMLEDRSTVRRGYPLAMLAIATRRAGGDLAALKQRYPQDQWPGEWPRALVDLAFDGGDGRSTLAAAKAQKSALEAQTEAHFYIGELAAATGDIRKARDHWQSTVDLGVVEFVEYNAARQRLKTTR